MPMPSIVWDYFDEFEGGGKCRLCGCIRNRKDKSTSTFWQHLERVHGLDKRQMATNSPISNLPSGKMRHSTDSDGTKAQKRPASNQAISEVGEHAGNKMPKLDLMGDLDQRATEETFKFISELVRQQHQSYSPSPMPLSLLAPTVPMITEENENHQIQPSNDSSAATIKIESPIGISLNSLEDSRKANAINNNIEALSCSNSDSHLPLSTEERLSTLNDYINGLIDINDLSPKNGSSSSSAKAKSPSVELTPTKKRNDNISWDEFFMSAALLAAQRSKDPSTQVGACIVKDNIIVGLGYNGMPIGCNDDEMPWGKRDEDPLNTKYPYVCHAEMNAILNKNCVNITGTTIYSTLFPCCECAKMIIQSRIMRVVYLNDKDAIEMAASKRLFDITGIKYSRFESTRNEVVIRFK